MTLLASFAPALANHLWQSTAFAAVTWLATLLLRRNQARMRYGLWLAASVKFLVPFSLLIALGGMLPRPHHAVVTMPVYSAVDDVSLPFDIAPSAMPAATLHSTAPARHIPDLTTALAGLWLCGVLVVLGMWCRGWLQVARTLRLAMRVNTGREAAILRQLQQASGSPHIRLALSRDLMEPGVFGLFRPILIWPERLSQRLDDEHIEAILAHELMHVRRRDNLSAALHMLVEAAFWFHPLVWWMERRMVEERERACDEAVVEMGSRPGIYAESLLKAVRFCVESPLVCIAGITGADLNRRVRSIMTLRLERLGLAGKLTLMALGVAAVAAPVAFGVVRMIPLCGQVLHPTGPLPSYETVVIRPTHEGERGADTQGEQTHYLITAKLLIQFAYASVSGSGKPFELQVIGGPDWINTDVFDILAKTSSASFLAAQKMTRVQGHEQRQLMEQSLLADRFKLKVHTETRDRPVYGLTAVRGGPKLTPARDATGGWTMVPRPSSTAPTDFRRGIVVRATATGFEMTVKGMTLDSFTDALMAQKETSEHPVVNQTGLAGAYDFTLRWGPEQSAAADSANIEDPPLFTAIQQQLGLKLADSKAPAEAVVIDHIEKPVFDNVAIMPPAPAARLMSVALTQAKPLLNVAVSPDLKQDQAPQMAGANANKVVPMAADAHPSFAVAAIKPHDPSSNHQGFNATGDRFIIRNEGIISLMMFAYSIDKHQIVDLPDWVDKTPYDIEGITDTPGEPNLRQQQEMIRKLLADRFQLKFHPEKRDLPVYAIQVAKGGPTLKAPANPDAQPDQDAKSHGTELTVNVTSASIADFIMGMQFFLDRPLIDQTGLTGYYDFSVRYTYDEVHATDPNAPPGIATAFQEQLGLKLQATKAPANVFVIDHVERPSEN